MGRGFLVEQAGAMPTKHSHADAVRLAGALYGKILNRNADKAGFDYVLYSLQEGKQSVQQHALEMIASDEFNNKFVRGRDPKAVAILLNRILMGLTLEGARIATEAEDFTRLGLKKYVKRITMSKEFRRKYNEDQIPGIGH